MLVKQTGVTFLEEILVIALISIFASLSALYYSRFLLQNAVANTEDEFVSQLRKAQLYALNGKADSSWGVSYSGSNLLLFATASSAYNEVFTIHPNLTITGFSTVIFQKITGQPSTTPTTVISAGNNTETFSLNSQGVVER